MQIMRSIRRLIPSIGPLHDHRNGLLRIAAKAYQTTRYIQAQTQGRLFVTDFAYHPKARQIENTAGGRNLISRLNAEEGRYASVLRDFSDAFDLISKIALDPESENDAAPYWYNDWLPPVDGISIYGLLATLKPRRYVEVGSGHSTRFARRAISDLHLATKIVSIDPKPRSEIDLICDEIIRMPLEELPKGFWNEMSPEDLLFVDNSHRSLPNSDVTVFFLEVLPALPGGMVYGLHDIFLPYDYPEGWMPRYYNEQYLLQVYLNGGAAGDEILAPMGWIWRRPNLRSLLSPIWQGNDRLLQRVEFGGAGAFWMRRSLARAVEGDQFGRRT